MSTTNVILLGTGTPNPLPERSGPAVAIVVDDRSYLVDCGTGIVRQAEKARRLGYDALAAQNLKTCFLTHLHSDHTLGFADLIFTPWVLEREEPLKVFGPVGTNHMTKHIVEAYDHDILARRDGLEGATENGCKALSTEIKEGIVYSDDYVVVEAFQVQHPPFDAYGYKFTTKDKVIVVSGDTVPCDNLIKHAAGCDILIHEVYSSTGIKSRDPKWFQYHTNVHTSSIDLGMIAKKSNPKLLVLYHQLFMVAENESGESQTLEEREQEMIDQIKENYGGVVVSAKDMDVF